MKHINEFKTKKFTWINASRAAAPQINYLAKKHNLLPEDEIDVLPPIQRSKLVERPDYIFMILLFPYYDREGGDIRTEEIDFFITKNRLITVHNNKIPAITKLFSACQDNPKTVACAGDMANLLYQLLNDLLNYCFPMMRHLNLDLENMEQRLFKDYEKKSTVDQTVRIKTNIFDFQRIMQSHEYVITKLIDTAPRFFPPKKMENNFIHLVEYIREIGLSLQSFKDAANALHEANTTLVNYRVNEIAKMLSVFAVIVFPLTLLAAIFGMNTANNPIVGSDFDFWKIIGIMIGSGTLMLVFFKWRRWI